MRTKFDASISVVIPTHNRRDLVAAAIHTAAAQVHLPMEIIIVDDASTDGTDEAVAAITTSVPVIYLRLDTNRGGGFARNAGVQAASGNYIAFLDSDDEWTRDHLSRAVSIAANEPDENFVISSRAIAASRVLPPILLPQAINSIGAKDYVLFQNLAFQTSTLLIPRSTARLWQFDSRLRRHQDWDLVFRMVSGKVRLRQASQPTVHYNVEPGGKVSKTRSAGPSRRFLARHRNSMSARARRRFWLLEIRQREEQGATIADLVLSAILGAISLGELRHYLLEKMRIHDTRHS